MSDTSTSHQMTCSLLTSVLSLSVGTWFPIGYSLSQINAPQDVIVSWMRSVQCQRLFPDTNVVNTTTADFLLENSTYSRDFIKWCDNYTADGVVNNSISLLKDNPTLNMLWALTGASMSLGACVTIWFTNFLIATFGFRNSLHVVNIPAILGTFLCGFCVMGQSYEMLIIGRFLLGINMGLASSILPLYVAELSPPNLRGAMGTVPTLLYVFGMLIAVILGIPQILGTDTLWAIMSWLRLIPSVILFFSLLLACPESPRYSLLCRNDRDGAKTALQWLRQVDDVEIELKTIETEGKTIEGDKIMSIAGLFTNPFLRRNMIICALAMIDQRFSGYAAIYPYSSAMFASIGLAKLESLYGTIGVMGLQVITTAVALMLIDRAGRKLLLIAGNIGCLLACMGMIILTSLVKHASCSSCEYGGVICILIFIISYNTGPGTVPWVLPAEMFSKSSRGSAITVVTFCCHASTMLVSALYPIMQASMEEWTFLPYAVALLGFTVYFWWDVVETKGKSFTEIQALLWAKAHGNRQHVVTYNFALSSSNNGQHHQTISASTLQSTVF